MNEIEKGKKVKEPEKKEPKKLYRSFTVEPGMSGFKVKIGCSEVYFGTAKECADAIASYLMNPQGIEKKYLTEDQRLGMGQAEQTATQNLTTGTIAWNIAPEPTTIGR